MNIRVFDDASQIAVAAGEVFVSLIRSKPDAALGLATGASPVALYQYLISQYRNGNISFRAVSAYNLDEYCDLPVEDKNSYYTFMRKNLFDHIDILPENTHIPNGNAPDMAAECRRYDGLLAAIGGVDLQLLGLGTDCHIGFNEPADAFANGTFRVKLHESTIESNSVYFDENPMPRYAVTMGAGTIMTAKKIVLIATGKAKAQAVLDMVKGPVTPRHPASILQEHADATVYLDKAAAALL